MSPLDCGDSSNPDGDEVKGEVFLTSYDFDANKIRQSRAFRSRHALGMERLRKTFFEAEGSRKRLFIFDSCYSGDFPGPRYRSDEADPVQGYIKYMLDSKSTGRVALLSCLPIQKAREDPTRGHGLFTYYLLRALSGKDPEALRRDGWLTVNGLFDYIARKLPEDQRPVLSGVQQDSFDLICYPQHAQPTEPTLEHGKTPQDRRCVEKEQRLRAMFADHSSFMHDHLESFVGRQVELAEIRLRIREQMPTGGYVTITGQAGQGKSSIIAQLVQEHIAEQGTEERVIYHFIPFNPGPDHQVGLLRNLIARLMFKYDLSDLYIDYVAYGNRPALHDFLPRILQEIADKGVQETIYIDGLDQLEEDFTGLRDLTFLPPGPPTGIVIVLGTRPNDTLHPLELLKPHYQYALPNLSRFDFDLILQPRGVYLSPDIADQFYRTMQGNAIFLDLVAKELIAAGTASTPNEMIKKLANNPANLFSFALARLERAPEWEIIEQVLGLLLASREPLSLEQLRHMMSVKAYRLRNAISRLGGLLTESTPQGQPEQRRYSLFHLMFQDFLGQNEHKPQNDYLFATSEVERYHSLIARWCEGEQLALIWQDTRDQVEQERRAYARQHYITHLYLGKEWSQLFDILNQGAYGRAKVQHDPSMRSYTLDLELGRLAWASPTWSLAQGIEHLSLLWRYTLLQCSLASRADNYPDEAFQILLLLRQEAKAIGLAELLTDPSRKVQILLRIANHLAKQSNRKIESDQLFTRANEVVRTIQDAYKREEALSGLAQALAQAGQWERAEASIVQIEDIDRRGEALSGLAQALAQAGQWERAEASIAQIKDAYKRGEALSDLAQALAQAGQWERAEASIARIENAYRRGEALFRLIDALNKVNKYEQSLAVVQHSWLQATTRFEALNLLQIATPFIVLKPDLGVALVEAFPWVDSFLRR